MVLLKANENIFPEMEGFDAAAWVVSVVGTGDPNAVAALTGKPKQEIMGVSRPDFAEMFLILVPVGPAWLPWP